MKSVLKPCALGGIFSVLFLCSCTTTSTPPLLPADVSMNPEAGRGGYLIVMLRVNDGEPLPFIVDTGSAETVFDQSLEPKLGKRVADATDVKFGVSYRGDAYRPPKLYLGDTLLRNNGAFVTALDFKSWAEGGPQVPFKGILGMDVLKHYCIQLNFQSGQMRFLDATHADKKDWGRPFHLTRIDWLYHPVDRIENSMTIDENLTGTKGRRSMIDTGDEGDGWLTPELYRQWTNQAALPVNGEFHSPNGTLGGDIYHELDLGGLDKTNLDTHTQFNTIGLHVLSQNLVTFDFPGRTMYLKRTSDRPLVDKKTEAVLRSEGQAAGDFSWDLMDKGQLPGWAKSDVAGDAATTSTLQTNGLVLVTLDIQKKGESSVYHCTVTRASKSSPWKLQKAWLTDQGDKTIKEYTVP